MTYGPTGSDQPLTGWERPTGEQPPTGYEPPPSGYAVQAPPVPPQYPDTQYHETQYHETQYHETQHPEMQQHPGMQPHPGLQPQPAAAPSRRRMWIIASAGAAAVFVLTIVALLVFVPARSGPAGEFDEAAETFHSRFDSLQTRLVSDVQAANSGMMDPSLAPVKTGANEIENVLETYANAVSAIVVPPQAVEARDRLIQVTQAARLTMTAVATSFTKGQAQTLLNGAWPSVVAALDESETALRAALKE
jgi:hypothetical protein